MLLSDQGLEEVLATGDLKVDPYDRSRLQPSSLDLTLDRQFVVFHNHKRGVIDPKVDNRDMTEAVTVSDPEDPFILHPGEFVLACTTEVIGLSAALAARIEGKSSLGRLGLLIHATAGFIDPGFHGQVTLELANLTTNPILLYSGMPVAQLCCFRLEKPARVTYDVTGKYSGQLGPQPSRYFLNYPYG